MFWNIVRYLCQLSVYLALKKPPIPTVFDHWKAHFGSDIRKEAVRWLFRWPKFHGIGSFRLGRVYDWKFEGVFFPNFAILCQYVELSCEFLQEGGFAVLDVLFVSLTHLKTSVFITFSSILINQPIKSLNLYFFAFKSIDNFRANNFCIEK